MRLGFLKSLITFYITLTQVRANLDNSTMGAIIDSEVGIRNLTISGNELENHNTSTTELPVPMCHQPTSYQGNCRASIGRWSWDLSTDTCTYFIYSGCDGNDNNFRDAEDCFVNCGSENTNFDIEELVIDIYGEEWEMIEGADDFREQYQQMVDEISTKGLSIAKDWENQWEEPEQEIELK